MRVHLDIPDALAHEAHTNGLLTSESMAKLLRAEIERRRRERFFEAADRLAAQNAPLSAEEVEAEIGAARARRLRA